jgi:hypothetical protein
VPGGRTIGLELVGDFLRISFEDRKSGVDFECSVPAEMVFRFMDRVRGDA